ncbi:hypothetical protein [Vibrio phage BONAISHI]|nr:hypothetical protein [Vibrio phage BONAISHI]
MSSRKTESELDNQYEFLGTILPLFINGQYHCNEIFGDRHSSIYAPSETVTIINLTHGKTIFYVRPDGAVGIAERSHHIHIRNDHHMCNSEKQAIHDAIGDFNHLGGVLIQIRASGTRYEFPEQTRPDFKIFEVERVPSPGRGPSHVFDYYIHIPEHVLSNKPEGFFVPHVGFTVSLYRGRIKNQFLENRGLCTANGMRATGWYIVLDSDESSYASLWYKLTNNFEEVRSIGTRNGKASETIKIYRFDNSVSPVLVKTALIDDAIDNGVSFENNGVAYHIPFFLDKRACRDWIKAKKEKESEEYIEEINKLRDHLRKSEERAKKAEENADKEAHRARKAEQKQTETKDSIVTRALIFFAGLAPTIVKLVTWLLK